jgi:DNA polymerase-4
MTSRKIIHIDMDAFYASVEQRDNPQLQGKPIAVGHGEKRGVVAAASYEARKFGVRSAMASVTALRLCPGLIFAPPRFHVYKVISEQIRKIFSDYTALIEPLSLDEAYLDVTENLQGISSATMTALEIRKRIYEETGLNASAGISYNKFLAKLASDYKKPNGQFVILPADGKEFVEKLSISKFHGVGEVTANKMHTLGIYTGADLGKCSIGFLEQHFGKMGAWYYKIARGEDNREVISNRPRKSYGSETTYAEDLLHEDDIIDNTLAIADEVWQWCVKTDCYGRTITLKFKFSSFHQITRSQTCLLPISKQEHFLTIIKKLMQSIFPLENSIRLSGVCVSNFGMKQCQRSNQLLLKLFD